MRREVSVESLDVKGLSRDGKVNAVATVQLLVNVPCTGEVFGDSRLNLCDLLLLNTVLPNQHVPGGTLVRTGE